MTIQEINKRYYRKEFHTASYIRNAIAQGVMPNLERMNPDQVEEFYNTFAGYVMRKKNGRLCLCHLKDILGKVPALKDFTKRNLEKINEEMSARFSPNSVKLETSIIISALNYFKDEVDLPCHDFAKVLSVKSTKSESVFLTEQELDRFAQVVPNTKEERYAQRIFMIMAKTGMRFSDATKATMANVSEVTIPTIDGNFKVQKVFTYTSQKTKITAKVPCGDVLCRFLSDEFHHSDESVLFNAALRDICKRANIDAETTLYRKGRTETGKKYEFISSHTARRSFVTNLYLRGMDLLSISKLAGHSGVAMTERYVKAPKPIENQFMDFFQ